MNAIFVYGSNLDPAQMRARCPSARMRSSAALFDHDLAFVGHSSRWGGAAATVRPAPAKKVLGALYELSDRELAVLDAHEGGYVRVARNVIVPRARVRAELYVRPFGLRARPSAAYLEAIARGYRSLGYPLDDLLPYWSEP
jgi:gamma-glutamylcyclotransferase